MFYKEDRDTLILNIRVQPNSSKNQIVGLYDNSLKIKVTAAAVEGAANKELKRFLSKQFGVSKSEIEILKGESSRQKVIRVPKKEEIVKFIERISSGR